LKKKIRTKQKHYSFIFPKNKTKQNKMPGASILPTALHNGKLYFLLGRENPMEDTARGFSDFGGGVDAGESVYEAAMREGSEELTGFLGNPTQLREKIEKHGGVYKIVNTDPKDTTRVYTIHIFHFPYDPLLPEYYNNNHQFLWNRMNKKDLNNSKLFEKIEIDWFCETDLQRRMKEYRPFYATMMKRILVELPQIRQFIQTCLQKYSPPKRTVTASRKQQHVRKSSQKQKRGGGAATNNNKNNNNKSLTRRKRSTMRRKRIIVPMNSLPLHKMRLHMRGG
jgi:8-oxo-dGTP pyrophosphatase MutT (NUDIX family)